MIIDHYAQVSDTSYSCHHLQLDTVVDDGKPLIKCAACAMRWKVVERVENKTPRDNSKRPRHCDDYIQDFAAPRCLRFFLLVQRMPALDAMLCRAVGVMPKLFATYEGRRVRVVMASRIGDVGITGKLDAEDGYERRVMVSDLTNFGETP